MPYIVTTTSGSALATIPDNTVNTTTTSLALVGKNYAGYGAFLNENYVKLLENFSNSTAPSTPIRGQLWYDSTNTLLKVWTGSQWKQMHSSAAGPTEPPSKITGDLWWDTTNLVLKVYGGSAWITIGPGTTGGSGGGSGSTTGAIVDTIIDSVAQSHAVIKLSISNQIIGIISKDSAFTPQTAITGFATIYPGITLINGGSLSGVQFTGNATNALTVNNISSGSFLRSDLGGTVTGSLAVANDTSGITIGNTSTHTISVSSGAIIFKNNTVNSDIKFFVNKSGTPTQALAISANTTAVTFANSISVTHPVTAIINGGTSGIGNIGAVGATFNTVFAKSTTAQYADLAEIYLTDKIYEVGTVVKIGGTAEVTAATYGDRAIGVISANPAFLMNNTAKGQPVALKGRVPVKVQGTIRKGDKLIPAQNIYGAASTIVDQNDPNYFAIALGDHQQDSGIVECLIL
jgi:hypothetical protein